MVQTTPTFTQTSDTVLKLGFLSVGVFCTVCNPTERKPKRRFSMYCPRAQSSSGWPQALGHCSQQLYTLIMMQLACAHLCCTAATGSDRWVLGSWSSSRAFYSNLGALQGSVGQHCPVGPPSLSLADSAECAFGSGSPDFWARVMCGAGLHFVNLLGVCSQLFKLESRGCWM